MENIKEKSSDELWVEYINLEKKIENMRCDMWELINKAPPNTTLYDFKHKYNDLYKLHKQILKNHKAMFLRAMDKFQEWSVQNRKEVDVIIEKLKNMPL